MPVDLRLPDPAGPIAAIVTDFYLSITPAPVHSGGLVAVLIGTDPQQA